MENKIKGTIEIITLPSYFIGVSLSWGTMRDIDLLEAFLPFLEAHDPTSADYIKEEYADIIEKIREDKIETENDLDDASYLINEGLFDALNNIAPEGCYFGSHVGDGSDYGFWMSEDDLDYSDDFNSSLENGEEEIEDPE